MCELATGGGERVGRGGLRRAYGAFLFLVGYLLSPLTWWNDALVNLPIAWAVASAAAWLYPPLFTTALVVAYWGTNLAGLLLMGTGGARAAAGQLRGRTGRWLIVGSMAYTIAILALVRVGWIRPLPAFWRPQP